MRNAATPAGVSDTRCSSDLISVGIPTFMQTVPPAFDRSTPRAFSFDDTVHAAALAI
jgi:hypothetical protein